MVKWNPSRRALLGATAGLALGERVWPATAPSVAIGITDWNLKLTAKPDAIEKASKLGFKGLQVSFGRELKDGKLPLDSPDVIAAYLKLSKQTGVTIDGTCVDRLHDNGLKSDPLASRWVSDAIRLTRALRTQVVLLPFFGPWALKTKEEMAHVGDALRELAPQAEKAGVILAIEDTISAEDNVRIMERSRSKNVLVYYDIGNSTQAGFDIVKEIRWLGKERICQMHFKDNPHLLGQGPIQLKPVIQVLRDIGWSGWANLETDSRPNRLYEDLQTNLAYVRQVMSAA